MVDNEAQIQHLEDFAKSNPSAQPWDVFIKIDVGSHRAGMETSSPLLPKLVRRVEESPAARVYGFYCHAGHSYGCRTTEAAAAVLKTELEGVLKATEFLIEKRKVVVSVGSTPTAHVVRELSGKMPDNVEVELHAGMSPVNIIELFLTIIGNYPANDLQQVATGLVSEAQQAVRVVAEVCSVYPSRNEALINAGTIALSKETSDTPGHGRVTDRPGWSVMRMAQEHGILGLNGTQKEGAVADTFRVGEKVFLFCQHACITAAAHFQYYVVDEKDIVREVWVPWKGW